MVNLNDTQSTLRRNVEREKATFDSEWKLELSRHKAREEELKRPVRSAISLADQAGVPQLQIARAAGFNQVNQLLNWMRDKTGGNLLASALSTPQRSLDALGNEVAQLDVPVFLEVDNGVWEATWADMTTRFTLYNYDDQQKVAVVEGQQSPWFEVALKEWNENVLLGWPDED